MQRGYQNIRKIFVLIFYGSKQYDQTPECTSSNRNICLRIKRFKKYSSLSNKRPWISIFLKKRLPGWTHFNFPHIPFSTPLYQPPIRIPCKCPAPLLPCRRFSLSDMYQNNPLGDNTKSHFKH